MADNAKGGIAPDSNNFVKYTGITGSFNQERVSDLLSSSAFVIGTGNWPKIEENQRALLWYNIVLHAGSEAIGGEDSEENFSTYAEIVRDKSYMLEKECDEKTRAELREVCNFLGIEDISHLRTLVEDRGLIWDSVTRDHPSVASVWEDLKQHPDPLVREAFEEGHAWPGKRFNEVRQACGGTIKLFERQNKAAQILKEAGVVFKETHDSEITYKYSGMKGDLLPEYLPERDGVVKIVDDARIMTDGDKLEIIVHKREEGRRFRRVTEELKRQEEERVNPLDPDDLDVPPGQTETYRELWSDPDSGYHDHHSLYARAIHDIMTLIGVPKLSKPMKLDKVNIPEAKILSGRQISDPDVFIPKTIAGYEAAKPNSDFKDLGTYERQFSNAHGVVFEKMPQINTGSGREKREQTKRKILTLMGVSYCATMGNLGVPGIAGQPLILHRSLIEKNGPLHFIRDLYAAGTVSKDPERMFRFYESEEDLKGLLSKGWDPRRFRNVPEPVYHLKDEQWMKERGVANDKRYGVSFLGSSVCREQDVNDNARAIAYVASVMGAYIDHGAGTRGTMDQFFEGSVQAYLEGYRKFVNRGYRTPVIKKEGSIRPKVDNIAARTDLPILGDLDSGYQRIGNNFVIIVEDTLGARQHLTTGQSNAAVYNKPGTGTLYELGQDLLHNCLVAEGNDGLNKGFSNESQRLLALMNTAGCYNFMYGLFDEEERKTLQIEGYNNSHALMFRLMRHAEELEYAVPCELQNEKGLNEHLQAAECRV